MISDIYQKKFSEAGFEVLAAEAGDQALALAEKNSPDIILLDLILPKMNGFDVIEHLRASKYGSGIKIIVFSNLSQTEDREKAMKLGADGFVSKSDYTPSELVKEVSRLLGQFEEEKKNEANHNGNHANGHNSHGSSKKILMMEDEEIFREMFGEKLIADGFEVDFAEDGVSGAKKALEGNYALFIIDMVMPNMNGDEIVAKLQLEEKTMSIPIIVLSASVDEEAQREMETRGINAFFVKTQLVPSELSKKVEEILNK